MDRLLADFASLHWWITVVVVGLVLNLVAAYLKTPIDRLLAQLAQRREARVHQMLGSSIADARSIASQPALLALEIRAEAVCQRAALLGLVFGAVFGATAFILPLGEGAISAVRLSATILAALAAFLSVAFVLHASRRGSLHTDRVEMVHALLRQSAS